jgi:hypothetical protein
VPFEKNQSSRSAIIPLGSDSRRDSSGLPEGCSPHRRNCLRRRGGSAFRFRESRSASRAGSPLLFGLAPRGVFRACDVAIAAVGFYPTFSPLPNETSISKTSRRFTCAMSPCCSAGGLFSVALSVNDPDSAGRNRYHRNRSPGVTWRVAPGLGRAQCAPKGLPVTGSREPTTVVSGLSSRPAIFR